MMWALSRLLPRTAVFGIDLALTGLLDRLIGLPGVLRPLLRDAVLHLSGFTFVLPPGLVWLFAGCELDGMLYEPESAG